MSSRRRREPRLTDSFRTRNTAMRNLLQTVDKVLDRDVPILILGESGSGKDRLAQAIHACGPRRERPFVHIDCPTIPPDLFESELFGYEKGTFTDAQNRKLGKLEMARGGTIYFDDISALAPPLQAKLLRAVQEKSFTRLGGHEAIAFDARILSSSSADLEQMLTAGRFRRDLYYRINVVTVNLPSLRERADDIPLLVTEFAGRKHPVSDTAMALLKAHRWQGNVRELRNTIERALVDSANGPIDAESLRLPADDYVAAASRAQWTLEQLEETYIRTVIRDVRSNYSRAAEILGINRKTLLEKRKKYGID